MARPQLFTTARNARDRLLRPRILNQAGLTPFRVIHEEDIIRVRYYPPLPGETIELAGETVPVAKQPQRTPLVIVPPLAVNMLIYDLFPHRSLVKYLRARGFELYLVDWGRPTREHDDYHLHTYFADLLPRMLERIREHAGTRRLSLHGWSFGGLFSLCHAAVSRDPDLANLVLVGAPNDYYRNGDLGRQYRRMGGQVRRVRKITGLRVHNMPRRFFRSPGWANSLGFKLLNPVGSLQGYWSLVRNLSDRDYVRDHATNAAFLEDMVAYPGGVMQDVIHYLLANNVLAKGKLPMEDTDASLADVTQPILNIAGRNDTIVTIEGSQHMFDRVKSTDTTCLEVPGGHMGILGGSKAPKASWQAIADWLIERDQ